MQKTMLQVEGVTSNALLAAVSDLLDCKLKNLHPPAPTEPDAYITRQDVADLFKISLPTVHAWVNAGVLKAYKIANKTRFLLSEVKAAAKEQSSKRERTA